MEEPLRAGRPLDGRPQRGQQPAWRRGRAQRAAALWPCWGLQPGREGAVTPGVGAEAAEWHPWALEGRPAPCRATARSGSSPATWRHALLGPQEDASRGAGVRFSRLGRSAGQTRTRERRHHLPNPLRLNFLTKLSALLLPPRSLLGTKRPLSSRKDLAFGIRLLQKGSLPHDSRPSALRATGQPAGVVPLQRSGLLG